MTSEKSAPIVSRGFFLHNEAAKFSGMVRKAGVMYVQFFPGFSFFQIEIPAGAFHVRQYPDREFEKEQLILFFSSGKNQRLYYARFCITTPANVLLFLKAGENQLPPKTHHCKFPGYPHVSAICV